eukprot:TRINITY_DN56303_c0_g1_i4.p1 TRINITY_DN56303_c0_g1~~TRINITY_DN56303_c0_g1_i4.p1  ORF type:complete len:279 (+),score=16.66 TRINITY_DN56303_c0_g1_i4:122-958(+)
MTTSKRESEAASDRIGSLEKSSKVASAKIDALEAASRMAKQASQAASGRIGSLEQLSKAASSKINSLESASQTAGSTMHVLKSAVRSESTKIEQIEPVVDTAETDISDLKKRLYESHRVLAGKADFVLADRDTGLIFWCPTGICKMERGSTSTADSGKMQFEVVSQGEIADGSSGRLRTSPGLQYICCYADRCTSTPTEYSSFTLVNLTTSVLEEWSCFNLQTNGRFLNCANGDNICLWGAARQFVALPADWDFSRPYDDLPCGGARRLQDNDTSIYV